ncbi:helix-turn-helix transcriptional regulator [Paenibacillus sp. GXUN7292]|uniref:helix-turn-helix transcriptional regulator n=1 Tax=Paenibacillus sp. GXUN7292 TaxID=3422499 RepID=UPI003D7DDE1B
MNRKWLNRQLLSYVPIFLLMALFIAYLSFFTLSEMSKRSSEQVNEVATSRLLQLVDYSLQEIDKLMIKEISDNPRLLRFFYAGEESALKESEASETIRSWTIINPMIQSVYLYRRSDDIVLTNKMRIPLGQFSDAEFLIQHRQSKPDKPWIGPRDYIGSSLQSRTDKVVSLVKEVPFINGELGVLVVNVSTNAIEGLLNPGDAAQVSFVDLLAEDGHPIHERSEGHSFKILTEQQSDYTGWTIRSGIQSVKWINLSEGSIVATIVVGILSIVISAIWFVYVTRLNYKPIGIIMKRITTSARFKEGGLVDPKHHELAIIDHALDKLIRQSIDYEKTHEEDLIYRRKVFFQEVLQGERIVTAEGWPQEMKRLQLPEHSLPVIVIAIEIDQFAVFSKSYDHRDQNLLKFAVSNVVRELAQSLELYVREEWTESNQLDVLIMGKEDNKPTLKDVLTFGEQLRLWVKEHLAFSITIGVGNFASKPEQILLSCEQAEDALKKKIVIGSNQIILFEDGPEEQALPSILEYLPDIHQISRMYRMGESKWQEAYEHLFQALRSAALNRDDAVTLINVFLVTLHREMLELPSEYKEMWRNKMMPQINEAFAAFEMIDELQASLLIPLHQFDAAMKKMRESRQYVSIVEQVRCYIDYNYANPDLSLAHLGDVFDTNPKYLSYIFKEQLGVKFVDYLAVERMKQAKKLLKSTEAPIPDIAERVGYVHAVSFNRVFKKIVGTTPGGYRSSAQKA